ncbi:MgtC/SapB family protein [Candidatus Jorgensenbacteria bacterium]|nr:MgtC/SapB family protein [Candidatus Jorgensenbacteria bacterium]
MLMGGMLSLEDMILRLVAAILFGGIVGLERELAGKEAGIRTDIMVAAGAAIFSIVGVTLPYLISLDAVHLKEVLARNSGFLGAVANVVVGVGFLGAGIIVKQGFQVKGLTTAATVWFVAAIGVLCGIGLVSFAAFASIILSCLLYFMRHIDLYKIIGKRDGPRDDESDNRVA